MRVRTNHPRHGVWPMGERDNGSVTVAFAMTFSMMLLAMSASIDTMDYGIARSRMQSALDVATISSGVDLAHYSSTTGTAYTQWQADALAYYQANMQGDGFDSTMAASNFSATVTGTAATSQTISLTATGKVTWVAPYSVANTTSSGGTVANGADGTDGTMTVGNTATRIPQSTVELVMVLDNTGSMADANSGDGSTTKMQGLQAASKTLISSLLTASSTNTYIGLVPFASTVNVSGALSASGSWLSQSFAYNKTNVSMSNWGGCVVEPRDSSGYLYPLPYSPSDTMKFTPYYYNVPPAGLTVTSYYQSYFGYTNTKAGTLCGTPSSTTTVKSVPVSLVNGYANLCSYSGNNIGNGLTYNFDQANTSQYSGVTTTLTQNTDCISHAVTFLTNNSTTLNNGINAMVSSGSTVIPTGLLWGWRMLSSSWSNALSSGNGWISSDTSFPKPETTQGLQRVMVVLTDGENDVGVKYLVPNDLYFNGLSGVGNVTLPAPTVYRASDGSSLVNGRMDSIELYGNTIPSDGVGYPDDINSFQSAACTAIKASGITIYSITFGSVTAVAKAAMQDCASPGNYYNAPTNAALTTIFQQIVGNLGILRLTQ